VALSNAGRNPEVLAIVLGGGRGTRLHPLTSYRSKPAVPLAGKYRLVDVPISNCIHSDIRKIFVLTQFNSASLNRHVAATYKFDDFSGGFVEILAAEQTPHTEEWFQGTADAVRRVMMHIESVPATHVLILAGDALYRMDYRAVLEEHIADGADITLSCKMVDEQQASSFGIVGIDESRRVSSFTEKPKGAAIPPLKVNPRVLQQAGLAGDASSRPYLASMGIYLFKRDVLMEVLKDQSSEDFGKQVIPRAISTHKIYANLYDGYWEDIGTISAFFQANLDLLADKPAFSFYDMQCPIFTHSRLLPSSEIVNSTIERAMIADGCLIRNATIRNAVVGIRSVIGERSTLENVIMMGADYFEDGLPGQDGTTIGIGKNVTIRNAIVDKNARIGDGARIVAKGGPDSDGDFYCVRDGVVIIPKNAVVPPGATI